MTREEYAVELYLIEQRMNLLEAQAAKFGYGRLKPKPVEWFPSPDRPGEFYAH